MFGSRSDGFPSRWRLRVRWLPAWLRRDRFRTPGGFWGIPQSGNLKDVSRPVARFRSSRRYLLLALMAACGSLFCAWVGVQWGLTWTVASVLFGLTAAATLALTLRPAIEIHETHLQIGRRVIFWTEIRRLDRTHWVTPLVVRLTLADDREVMVLHPGDADSSSSLLRHLCRYSREALLDGVPYSQFWGEPPAPRKQAPPPRPLLRPEDEEEVERLFQRLKTVGRLDQRGSDES